MKKIKYIFCLALTFVFSLCLVACSNNDPYTPSRPKPPKGSTTVATLEAVSTIMSDKLTGGELPVENFNYFSKDENGEYYYNTYVCAGISALSEIAKIKNLKDDTIYSGETLTLSSDEIEALRFELDYANKIEALYITNSTKGYETDLKVYILGSRATYPSNKYNSVLFAYDISYNSDTEKLVFSFNIAKTNSNIENGYVGSLFEFRYNTDFNIVECYKFKKERHFSIANTNTDLSNEIVANINLYSQIYFFTVSGTEETLPSNIYDEDIQSTIVQIITNVDNAHTEIFTAFNNKNEAGEGDGEQGEPSSQSEEETVIIPDSLIYIINSNKIEDFKDKLYGASGDDSNIGGEEPAVQSE